MKVLGNVIWHIPYLGFLIALIYAICGVFWCISIIGIPVGLGLFQLSLFMLTPFHKRLVSREDLEMLTGMDQRIFSFSSVPVPAFTRSMSILSSLKSST